MRFTNPHLLYFTLTESFIQATLIAASTCNKFTAYIGAEASNLTLFTDVTGLSK